MNNILTELRSMLHLAVELDVLDAMPVRIQLLPYRPPDIEFYDFGQFEALREAAAKVGPEVYLFVLLGGDLGLRLGEMLAAEQSDVWKERFTVSRAEWRGVVDKPKGGRSRTVPLTARLREALANHRDLVGPRRWRCRRCRHWLDTPTSRRRCGTSTSFAGRRRRRSRGSRRRLPAGLPGTLVEKCWRPADPKKKPPDFSGGCW